MEEKPDGSKMDGMSIATVSELRGWNIEVPPLDLSKMNGPDTVALPWPDALKLVLSVLRSFEISEADGVKILGLPTRVPNLEDASAALTDIQKSNLTDIHRIYIYTKLLYPKQPETRNHWIASKNREFGGRSPLEVMLDTGPFSVRRLLERYMNR